MKFGQKSIRLAVAAMIAGTLFATYSCGDKSKNDDSPQPAAPKLTAEETAEGLRLLKTYCVSCHSNSGKKIANVALDTVDDAKANPKSADEIKDGDMPVKKAGVPQPTDAERAKLVAFFKGLN
jgi:mono/diheme cytochrome c family protein